MTSYPISAAAERSGISPSALRYYDKIGLAVPSGRTAAGYRFYDDLALVRLRFIVVARDLGCSLTDIADLVALWDGGRCGAVQERLQELVADRIDQIEVRSAELAGLVERLHGVAGQLAGEKVDTPCGEACICVECAERAPEARSGARVPGTPNDLACTLNPTAVPDRLAEWHSIAALGSPPQTIGDGARRIEFADPSVMADLSRLVAAEQACCSFLAFAITVDERGTALEVRGPAGAAELVETLFGAR